MAEGFTNPILLVRSPCWLKWPFIVVSKAHVVHWIIELSMRSQSFVGFFDTFMALSSYPAQSDCLPSVWTNFCLKSPSQLMTSRAGRRCFWEIRKWTNKFNTSFPSSFHGPNMFQIGANPSNKTWFLAEGVRIWTEKSWVTLSIVGGFTHSPVWSPSVSIRYTTQMATLMGKTVINNPSWGRGHHAFPARSGPGILGVPLF
jgi:hypothetical protein